MECSHRLSRLMTLAVLVMMMILSVGCGASQQAAVTTQFAAPTAAPAVVVTEILPTPTARAIPTALPAPAIPENRRVVLESPPVIRAGDADTVRLTLEMDDQGNLIPTAEIAGHETHGQPVQIPNLYDTHHVMAEARLDIAGVQVVPNDLVSQSLLPGQAVSFYWSVHPQQVGTYSGTASLYLHFIPIKEGQESRRAISMQRIEIRAVDMLGLSGAPARIVGGVGAVIGSALGLDNVISWLWKLIKRKKQ